jgi:MazG family protein
MADSAALDALARLLDVMTRLRAPGGCPWDREQTHASLRPYVLEEAYEVADAIDRREPSALCDELGDLLLQVVFHAELGREAGQFSIADIAAAIVDKLERRHPHVFGTTSVADAAEVVRNWQAIKAAERARETGAPSLAGDVPRALPALARAQKVGERLAHAGFDWPRLADVLVHLDEERRELDVALASSDPAAIRHELGDLLLTVTSVARHLGISAEAALEEATARLMDRATAAQAAAHAQGLDLAHLPPSEQDRLWRDAKRAIRG